MVLSLERWVGKVAIVTGASSGIGEAIAEHLVENGIIVAGLARRVERVEENAKKLVGKRGKLYAVKCDVTIEENGLAAFKWVKENLGPIHILVNNAGLVLNDTLSDGNTANWEMVLRTNVLGLCICTREAVRDMKANDVAGHIIHINSLAGHKIPRIPNMNIYSPSKFAVTSLTETLRQEFNQEKIRIKISSISPGAVLTEALQVSGYGDDLFKKLGYDFTPLKSEEVADCVIFVLSTPPNVQIHEMIIRPLHETI